MHGMKSLSPTCFQVSPAQLGFYRYLPRDGRLLLLNYNFIYNLVKLTNKINGTSFTGRDIAIAIMSL